MIYRYCDYMTMSTACNQQSDCEVALFYLTNMLGSHDHISFSIVDY